MNKLLFVSPHLDDIIFSLGDYISKLDQEIIIVTVFTKKDNQKLKKFTGDYYAYANYDQRIKEDGLAMDILKSKNPNISVKYLDLEDEIFRDNNDFIQGEINQSFINLLKDFEGEIEKVYLPLCVGHHLDHILTFNTYKIFLKNNIPVEYYLDYPYATMNFYTKVRLSDFGNFQERIQIIDLYNYYINPINRCNHPIIRSIKMLIYIYTYIRNYIFVKNNYKIEYKIINTVNITNKNNLVMQYESQIKPIFETNQVLENILINHPDEKIIDILDYK